MMLSNVGLVAFHYKSYGTFLILKKPYNSTVELPTTEIIEPLFQAFFMFSKNDICHFQYGDCHCHDMTIESVKTLNDLLE